MLIGDAGTTGRATAVLSGIEDADTGSYKIELGVTACGNITCPIDSYIELSVIGECHRHAEKINNCIYSKIIGQSSL